MVKLYDWQRRAINSYKGNGVIQAITGSGKTLAGREIIKKLGGTKVVCAPTLTILDQWKSVLTNEPNIQYYTFQTLCKHKVQCKLLIVDEAHRSVSPEFIKLYDNVDYKYILGLTATPNDACIKKCGPIFCKVDFDEANVSAFKVHFIGIDLTFLEHQQYNNLSYSISQLLNNEHQTPEDKHRLEAIILKRRRLVYQALNRLPKAIELIVENIKTNHKVLVICQRIDQATMISNYIKEFIKPTIPHIVYHSNRKDDLEDYRKGKVKLCISAMMLKEGFDDPDTDVGIVVSTTLSKSFNLQAVGRIIRYRPNKEAHIYILLANQTTDLKVLDYDELYTADKINIKGETNPPELRNAYYSGEKFGFSGGRIWKNTKEGRVFMQYHFIINLLKKVKPEGGSFTVSDKGVYTKRDGIIHQVYPTFITINPLDKPLIEKIDLEELLKE